MEDSLVIKPKSKEKELAPTGLQPAVCCDIIDRGKQMTQFGEQHQLAIYYETQATDSDGEHFILSRIVTKSLHPKSTLRNILESWRGQPYSEDQISTGVDLSKLVGQPCMIHTVKQGDFINIENVLPPEDDQMFKGSGNYTRIKDR